MLESGGILYIRGGMITPISICLELKVINAIACFLFLILN